MKRKLIITTALIVTLGAVGGTFAIAKQHKHGFTQGADFVASRITRELDLDNTQQQALEHLKEQALVAHESVYEKFSATPDELTELLSGETFDQAKALDIVNSRTAAIDAVAPEMVASLGLFLDTLSSAQKQEVLEFVRKHHEKRRH